MEKKFVYVLIESEDAEGNNETEFVTSGLTELTVDSTEFKITRDALESYRTSIRPNDSDRIQILDRMLSVLDRPN